MSIKSILCIFGSVESEKNALSIALTLGKTLAARIRLLTEMFSFNQPKARSIHHFINKTARKILAYNFYIMLRC